jgi:hypothetical protein
MMKKLGLSLPVVRRRHWVIISRWGMYLHRTGSRERRSKFKCGERKGLLWLRKCLLCQPNTSSNKNYCISPSHEHVSRHTSTPGCNALSYFNLQVNEPVHVVTPFNTSNPSKKPYHCLFRFCFIAPHRCSVVRSNPLVCEIIA